MEKTIKQQQSPMVGHLELKIQQLRKTVQRLHQQNGEMRVKIEKALAGELGPSSRYPQNLSQHSSAKQNRSTQLVSCNSINYNNYYKVSTEYFKKCTTNFSCYQLATENSEALQKHSVTVNSLSLKALEPLQLRRTLQAKVNSRVVRS